MVSQHPCWWQRHHWCQRRHCCRACADTGGSAAYWCSASAAYWWERQCRLLVRCLRSLLVGAPAPPTGCGAAYWCSHTPAVPSRSTLDMEESIDVQLGGSAGRAPCVPQGHNMDSSWSRSSCVRSPPGVRMRRSASASLLSMAPSTSSTLLVWPPSATDGWSAEYVQWPSRTVLYWYLPGSILRVKSNRPLRAFHPKSSNVFQPTSSPATCTFAAPLKRYSAIVAGTGDRSSSRSAVAERTASILGLHVRAPSSWAYAAST
mmetsp:Transcript_39993/g.119113  ORF Transcript_39993/g.119113 Transcript_39993/m.119113 type:complete len:261 (-) Transcript_39993:689-1471(-)